MKLLFSLDCWGYTIGNQPAESGEAEAGTFNSKVESYE
jgi:hypothetical protein